MPNISVNVQIYLTLSVNLRSHVIRVKLVDFVTTSDFKHI